jgi:hypothetical protein
MGFILDFVALAWDMHSLNDLDAPCLLCSYVHMNYKRGDQGMAKETRVNAIIDPELKKRLYRVLLEEDKKFTDWLMVQIRDYLEKKEPKGKRKQGKGA